MKTTAFVMVFFMATLFSGEARAQIPLPPVEKVPYENVNQPGADYGLLLAAYGSVGALQEFGVQGGAWFALSPVWTLGLTVGVESPIGIPDYDFGLTLDSQVIRQLTNDIGVEFAVGTRPFGLRKEVEFTTGLRVTLSKARTDSAQITFGMGREYVSVLMGEYASGMWMAFAKLSYTR